MRCLVTGVAGFVGSSLADRLLADGHEVTGIDCFTDYYPREMKQRNIEAACSSKKFKFVEANLLDTNLESMLEGVEWIFHQAAQAGVRASWGKTFETYTTNNILGTQRLLEAARTQRGASALKKIVYASSSSVYGEAEKLPTRETDKPKPMSPYGVTKLAGEHLMVLYAREFQVPTVSLRYFTVYGPRQRPDMAFHRFIRAGLTRQPITIYGDGEQSRDFTFIEDIVQANILAAERQTQNLVFNIGGGSRVTVNHVLEQLRPMMDAPFRVEYKTREAGDAPHTGADTSLAKTELGYSPAIDLQTGLSKEVAWMRNVLSKE